MIDDNDDSANSALLNGTSEDLRADKSLHLSVPFHIVSGIKDVNLLVVSGRRSDDAGPHHLSVNELLLAVYAIIRPRLACPQTLTDGSACIVDHV